MSGLLQLNENVLIIFYHYLERFFFVFIAVLTYKQLKENVLIIFYAYYCLKPISRFLSFV